MRTIDRVPRLLPAVLVGGSCVVTLALLVAMVVGAAPPRFALLAFVGVSSIGVYGMKLGNRMMESQGP